MLKLELTYKNFEDEEVTGEFRFNLTKTEIVAMEFGYEDGLEATLRRIIKTNDRKALHDEFRKIVSMSYGVLSPDGNEFIKDPAVTERFLQSAAWDHLFFKLMTEDDYASNFAKGVLPSSLGQDVEKAIAAEREKMAPATPPVQSPEYTLPTTTTF